MTADVFAPLAALEGVGSAARAARDAVDVLLRDRGLRRVGSDATAEALLRGAHASAALAGSPSTLEEVRRGEGDPLSAGAVRMTGELMGLAPQADTAPVQVWTRLHQLAAAELGSALLPFTKLSGPASARRAPRAPSRDSPNKSASAPCESAAL